jgi:uncharacterized tellurite resistance protein B-like protein
VNGAVGLELIKLLLQVVFADDVVTPAERVALSASAERLAGPAGLELVHAVLDRRGPLPAPNMGLLAEHRADVLVEVGQIAAADGVNRDELDMIKTIAGMLK